MNRWQAYGMPMVLVVVVGGPLIAALLVFAYDQAPGVTLEWRHPWALLLLFACPFIAWVLLVVRRRVRPSLAYSRVRELALTKPGWSRNFSRLPEALRIIAVALLAIALAGPSTYRIDKKTVNSIDIMLVMDLSRSMREADMDGRRIEAGKAVLLRFLEERTTTASDRDRIGLVVFGEEAMLQSPPTLNYAVLKAMVKSLYIGYIAAAGTAIGDAVALAVSFLRRAQSQSRIIILLTDGHETSMTHFRDSEAGALAKDMDIKIFSILLGQDRRRFGGMPVRPEVLIDIAGDCEGGHTADDGRQKCFFRAGNQEELEASFRAVRSELEKTQRTIERKVPGYGLFWVFALAALIVLLLELVLRKTRFRRFP